MRKVCANRDIVSVLVSATLYQEFCVAIYINGSCTDAFYMKNEPSVEINEKHNGEVIVFARAPFGETEERLVIG